MVEKEKSVGDTDVREVDNVVANETVSLMVTLPKMALEPILGASLEFRAAMEAEAARRGQTQVSLPASALPLLEVGRAIGEACPEILDIVHQKIQEAMKARETPAVLGADGRPVTSNVPRVVGARMVPTGPIPGIVK